MRDSKRISEFLYELGLLWEQMPDMRFGQLYFMIYFNLNNRDISDDGFYIEDDIWLDKIRELQKDLV